MPDKVKSQLELATELPTSVRIPGLPDQEDLVLDTPVLTEAQSAGLVQLFTSEQWIYLQEVLEKWKTQFKQDPSVYMMKPNQASFDSGLLHCIKMLEFKILEANESLEFYANKNGRSTQEASSEAST